MKKIFIITILLLMPVMASAAIVVENNNSQSVTNSINISTNTGGQDDGGSDGSSSVKVKIETNINGQKVVDEEIEETGEESIELKVETKTKSDAEGESSVEIKKELKIDDEKEINSYQNSTVPSGQDDSTRAEGAIYGSAETNAQADNEQNKMDNSLVEEPLEVEIESEGKIDRDEQNDPGICDVKSSCEEESAISLAVNDDKNDSNIIKIIMNYFVNIFSKLIKVFT